MLLIAVFATTVTLVAQDDDLPPPTSHPKTDQQQPDANTPDDGQFHGFKTKKKVDLSNFIIEPDFNFSIGQGRIDLGFSPYVGYRLWKQLFGGGGVTYFYTGFRNIAFQDPSGTRTYYANANWHTFGAGVFLQYNIWHGFFARTKFEVLHRRIDDFYTGNVSVQLNPQTNAYSVIIPKVDKTIPALLVGVGYNLLQSKNFFFPLMVSYNLLYTVTDKNYSIYPKGFVVQLGFVNIF